MKDPSSERVMTAQELSFYLKLPLSTVYALTKKGIIRGVKFGKHWRYLEREIQEYLLRSSRFSSNPHPLVPSERREHPRINCSLHAELVPILYYNGAVEKTGLVQNLSAGGALFTTDGTASDFSLGDPVKLIFDLPSQEPRKIEVNGRVVRHIGDKNGVRACAVKFKALSAQDAEEINQYVG